MTEITVFLADESATLAFAASLAEAAESGGIIYLSGELGAGKTTLARGFLHALGHKGPVKSPTYTLFEVYPHADAHVIHMDLYRIADPEELDYLGLEDYFDQPGVIALIEWPEKAKAALPQVDLSCRLFDKKQGREMILSAHTAVGEALLSQILDVIQDL